MTTFVVMAGLPGTGKTTLARALAARLGGVVLSKDEVRAVLFPGELTDYTTEQDDLCMEVILSAAAYSAKHVHVPYIFLDGRVFSRAYQIERVIDAAEACGAPWKILHLAVPDEVARERLESADAVHHPAGNRDFQLYQEVKARLEPITRPKLDVDTSRPLEECVEKCAELLRDGR